MDHHGKCPKCDADWNNGDIFDVLRPQTWCANMTDEELKRYISVYYSPPYKFSRLIGIEYPGKYDGVWEYACPDCDARFPRFTKEKTRER
jgi:hypothetical protein